MKYLLIIFTFIFLVLGCESQNPTEPIDSNGGRLYLPSYTYIYNNWPNNPLPPGTSTGWISFQYSAGVATYKLKFELNRDIVVGGGGGGTDDYVTVQVKNPNGQTILNKVYHLIELTEWYTFEETLNNPENGGTHQVIINVPSTFYEVLWAKISTRVNTNRDIKHQ